MLNIISINYTDIIKDILKNKKYPNVGTIPKSNIKIVEIGKFVTLAWNRHLIKSDRVKLVVWAQTSPLKVK
jgi:hypothetical protein